MIQPSCSFQGKFQVFWSLATLHSQSGAPRLLRPPRPGPCLNFGLQLTLSQPGGQIMPTTVLWALSGSNSPWRPWSVPKYLLRLKIPMQNFDTFIKCQMSGSKYWIYNRKKVLLCLNKTFCLISKRGTIAIGFLQHKSIRSHLSL